MGVGAYHRNKTKEAIDLRRKFARAYNSILRDRWKTGRNLAGAKMQAATLAGFGLNSWCEAAAYKTRRVMASRMMSDPIVIEELVALGLKPHPTQPNEWLLADYIPSTQIDIEDVV